MAIALANEAYFFAFSEMLQNVIEGLKFLPNCDPLRNLLSLISKSSSETCQNK
jgi:hypothetical protein